ncbi:hypothetical protein DTO217A2_6999 [Paecilomyces variotii]|nr:hypothetical protein DTO217A2_6999 [Paecilomyces variotii]
MPSTQFVRLLVDLPAAGVAATAVAAAAGQPLSASLAAHRGAEQEAAEEEAPRGICPGGHPQAKYAAELASKGIAVPPEEDTEQMQLDKPKKNPTPGRWRDMRYVNEPGYVMNLEYGQHFGYVTWERSLLPLRSVRRLKQCRYSKITVPQYSSTLREIYRNGVLVYVKGDVNEPREYVSQYCEHYLK